MAGNAVLSVSVKVHAVLLGSGSCCCSLRQVGNASRRLPRPEGLPCREEAPTGRITLPVKGMQALMFVNKQT